MDITVVTGDGMVTRQFTEEMEKAMRDGRLEEAYSRSNTDSTILLFADEIPSSLNMTASPSLVGSIVPTITPTAAFTPTNLRGSESPSHTPLNSTLSPSPTSFNESISPSPSFSISPAPTSLNDTFDDDLSEAPSSATFNETISPVPTESPSETCIDANDSCSIWKNAGECTNNPVYMLENCKLSCNVCSENVTCEDSDDRCDLWAKAGECENNPNYMFLNCKQACGQCAGVNGCTDVKPQCSSWAAVGECDSNPQYMLGNCPKSCGECIDETDAPIATQPPLVCLDLNDSCEKWAIEGDCEANSDFMIENCPVACNACLSVPVNMTSAPSTSNSSTSCVDDDASCEKWASEGQCTSNSTYMLLACRQACAVCSEEVAI
jgi:hypothetical protein